MYGEPTLTHFLVLGAVLFALGIFGLLTRRNAVGILMSIELMFNAAAINFVAFTKFVSPEGLAGQVFTIFVLRNFIEDIPQDFFDAAEIDGAGMLRQVWTIVAPLSGPIIGTLAILRMLGEWNNFVRPLIYIRDPSRQLLAVGLLHLEGEYTRHWGEMMAGYTIASIPLVILFLFTMRLFIRGLSAGGVKG